MSIPCKKSCELGKRQEEAGVIQLPLLSLDGDHTDVDAALGCSSEGRIASDGRT